MNDNLKNDICILYRMASELNLYTSICKSADLSRTKRELETISTFIKHTIENINKIKLDEK